jgi:hypothetical protein
MKLRKGNSMSRRYIKLPHPGCNPAANDNALPELGELTQAIAVQIVGDDKDADAVVEWAAEKFGRASEDDDTAEQLRFALRVVIRICVKDTIVAECDELGLTLPNRELLEELAGDVAELTAAPLANRVIRRLAEGAAHAH